MDSLSFALHLRKIFLRKILSSRHVLLWSFIRLHLSYQVALEIAELFLDIFIGKCCFSFRSLWLLKIKLSWIFHNQKHFWSGVYCLQFLCWLAVSFLCVCLSPSWIMHGHCCYTILRKPQLIRVDGPLFSHEKQFWWFFLKGERIFYWLLQLI